MSARVLPRSLGPALSAHRLTQRVLSRDREDRGRYYYAAAWEPSAHYLAKLALAEQQASAE